MRRARSQQCAAVVLGEFLVAAVGLGVVAVGGLDQRAGLVGHDQARHAADELQGQHLGADPVCGGLARRGAGEGVVRRAQRSHEDLRLADLAGGRIDDGHRAAGIVDEQLLAGDMDLAHRALLGHSERAVLDAKTRVLVGQRVVAGVLLPQQHQGDAGALELLMHEREVRGELVARARHCRSEQSSLEVLVAQALDTVPVNVRRARQRDVLADHALGDIEGAADLGIAQLGLQVQAQCLSDSSHRDSVGWHRLSRKKR